MTPEDLEDEAARPRAPDYPDLTPFQRAQGRRLRLIHDMYRAELSSVAQLLEMIREAAAGPADLVAAVENLQLTRNLALFGTVCGQQCAVLQNHHDIEEQWMFPALSERAEAQLQAVIDRLIAEHEVILDLILALHSAARDLGRNPGGEGFDACAMAFQSLDRAIRSHFGYEETELEGALGAHEIPI